MSQTQPRATIIYDGECPFCMQQIERIRRKDRLGQFEYQPSQAPDLHERFPQLAGADFNSGMRLVQGDGGVLAGADAVHGIARGLPGWRRLAWLYRVPGIHGLARLIYGWIAANRQRLGRSCAVGACRVSDKQP